MNKNAFQWDAYHRPVDRIPACTAQRRGMSAQGEGGVSASGPGGCLPLVPGGVSQHEMGQTPHPLCGQTDTCENNLRKLRLRAVTNSLDIFKRIVIHYKAAVIHTVTINFVCFAHDSLRP